MSTIEKSTVTDSLVLLAKKPELTSFASLNSVKKALGTTKVGHTGTLDSFAQGLLVVCTGRLTRLAGNITAFNKTYKAVIKFGEETDTLEYTGKIVKTAGLPTLQRVRDALPQFTGNIMQQPPAFSAIHVDGRRASSLARGGVVADIPARPVTVFKAELIDIQADAKGTISDKTQSESLHTDGGPGDPSHSAQTPSDRSLTWDGSTKVKYALIEFSVSKGTYIRSLARDIGLAVGSAAHLVGLYRTAVGNFKVEDAAGYSTMEDFTIENVVAHVNKNKELMAKGQTLEIRPHFEKGHIPQEELDLQEEIRNTKVSLDKETAKLCGFETIDIATAQGLSDFQNGKPLRSYMFTEKLHNLPNNYTAAVFAPGAEGGQDSSTEIFTGLIGKNEEGRVSYKFVIN